MVTLETLVAMLFFMTDKDPGKCYTMQPALNQNEGRYASFDYP